jgi:hypothetical protein
MAGKRDAFAGNIKSVVAIVSAMAYARGGAE